MDYNDINSEQKETKFKREAYVILEKQGVCEQLQKLLNEPESLTPICVS